MEERVLMVVRRKIRLIAVSLTVALLFYFFLPLSLIFFPEVMNLPSFIFGVPWAWLYAFLLFPLTWFFVLFYHRNAGLLERQLGNINEEERT